MDCDSGEPLQLLPQVQQQRRKRTIYPADWKPQWPTDTKKSPPTLLDWSQTFRSNARAWHAGRDTEIAEFGRDDVIVAVPLYRMGDQLLVFALAVSVRGVKKIDADLARARWRVSTAAAKSGSS